MSLDGEKRERMQALTLAKDCYAMKLDLLSSATVVDRAVKFVENHSYNSSTFQNDAQKSNYQSRGYTPQNGKVTIDDTAEPQ
jgi:Cu/Ag efflux protein CusF